MSNFTQRILTSIALVIFVVTCVYIGSLSFFLLCLIINTFSLVEFYSMVERQGIANRKISGIILSDIILISVFLFASTLMDWRIILVGIPWIMLMFLTELYSKEGKPFQGLAYTFLGIAWITLPLVFFICVAFLPLNKGLYQRNIILGYFLILWANDTGAYLTGSIFGKRKLFERISPKKTWEGSAGGAMLAMGTAVLLSNFFSELNGISWLVVASLIVVFGTYGDLLKSKLKRSVNLKDSGSLLPGHGGFIDRFDSLVGSAPFVFAYMVFSSGGLK